MDEFERYGQLLKPDGTNQGQRLLPGLERDFIQPDERDLGQLFAYARAAAKELRFQTLAGQPAGDWSALFDEVTGPDGKALPALTLEARGAADDARAPQIALLFAFFRAFGAVQADLNALPVAHLAHYLSEVLALPRREAEPDHVHVTFELAKNAPPVLLEAGRELDAGTDDEGRALIYVLERQTVLTRARIAEIKRQVAARDRQGRLRYFHADAVPQGVSWASFGADPFDAPDPADPMVETAQGFAIADPLLRMAEGTRIVDIVARLASDTILPPPQILTPFLSLEATGPDGWFAPASYSTVLEKDATGLRLVIHLEISEAEPAVVDRNGKLHPGATSPGAPWPVLRWLTRPASRVHEALDRLRIVDLEIEVAVKEVRDLVLQNDRGALSPGGPVALFGPRPGIGANFYIGSREVFAKQLDRLEIDFDWVDLPENLAEHYAGYFDTQGNDVGKTFANAFHCVVSLLDGRSWDHRLTSDALDDRLIHPTNGTSRLPSYGPEAINGAFEEAAYRAHPDLGPLDSYGASTKRGFVRLKLTAPTDATLPLEDGSTAPSRVPFRAFGHDAFPRVYARAAVITARTTDDPTTDDPPALPNEPYTPTVENVRLGYGARTGSVIGDAQATTRVFTIGAFGYTEADAETPARLMPAIEAEGMLLLGFEAFDAPGTVSILFQLDDGTARLADPPGPSDIRWSHLAGNSWVVLPPSAVLVDETRGFQTSGIVGLTLAADATATHTAMPGKRHWLRAELFKPPAATARVQAAVAPAAAAVFQPAADLADFDAHLSTGLGAEKVTKLRRRIAAVKTVAQPYPSFGGRPSEPDRGYFQRAAERLRHRGRAVTVWDFERQVLERFDGVFKAKCLAHSNAEAEEAAGETALVIVPNLRASSSTNSLEPRASETRMHEIRAFVEKDLATPFSQVHVIHPVYERVLIEAHVAFRPGFDPGFYAAKLDRDLQRFLSPWAFEEGRDIAFGTRIYRSQLLKYVEDRPYLDYVTRFDLYHAYDGPPRLGVGAMGIGFDFAVTPDPVPAMGAMEIGTDFVVGRSETVAAATRAHAVLVSHPHHRIQPIIQGTEPCRGVTELGIGHMIVGLDFELETP